MTASLPAIAAEVARVLASIDQTRIDAARELIVSTTGAITTTGQGRSGYVATMTAMRFMHLGLRAHAASEATAPALAAGDLLLVVSGSGATPVSLGFARVARSVGARVLVVTREPASPLAGLADLVVEIPATGSTQPGGSLFEQTALLALDAVVRDIAQTIPDAAALLRARHTNLL
jgi:6-phospho-3-hexuloisomerase